MSSLPKKDAEESGKKQEKDESNQQTPDDWSKLPLPSEEKKLESHELHSSKAFVNVLGAHEGESNLELRESEYSFAKLSSEESDTAGPSQTLPPLIHGVEIVTDLELAQLAQVQPLLCNCDEPSVIQECFKMFEKKAVDYEIIKEFMYLEDQNQPGEFYCGNEPCNRDKNRYRDILP
ncbi:tyrosine-protein phosphatase non-receptor type 20 isoform X2 [Erinaceus europaeus]|uniref:Tyrosine-protein phosphatase non-receptor type 20 isoform X2 n=1 Tax=Erinaceus europaeus TaxID=9365 RepID=A0ABM3XEH5_ERIEU|nr:tyrosine-protein phosphatase non-receptor type 20 isoform X2 [Erinaceus europaeus]